MRVKNSYNNSRLKETLSVTLTLKMCSTSRDSMLVTQRPKGTREKYFQRCFERFFFPGLYV